MYPADDTVPHLEPDADTGGDAYGDGFPFTPAQLGEMLRDSYDRLETFREVRRRLIAEYVGPHYGVAPNNSFTVDVATTPDHHNLIQQTIDALLPNLVAKTIEPSVEPRTTRLALEAMARERVLEQTLADINLVDTHGQAVLDAFLGPWGIVWCGLKAGDDIHVVNDRQFYRGQFVAVPIDLDDYVLDQSAKRDTQALFEGHRFRIRRAEARACVRMDGTLMYDREVVDAAPTVGTGDRDAGEVQKIAGHTRDPYAAADWLEFWSVAVYADGGVWIATLDRLGAEARFVREPYRYWGQGKGPYRKLSFLHVPNNAVPLAFANRVRDLHQATKRISNKVVDDLLAAKDVMVYRPGDEDLADAIRTAANGQQIKGDPQGVAQLSFGGAMARLFPALEFIRGMANDASGGSQLEGGSKDNSKTATGASIIAGRQQTRAEWMQARSLRFLDSIIQAAAWYQANDPFLQATVVQRLPGGERVELRASADVAQGSFDDFQFKVKALVNRSMDPMVRASKLIELVSQMPALSQLGQQAFTKIMTILSSALDIPELDEINPDPSLLAATEQQMQLQAMQTGGGMGAGAGAMQQQPGPVPAPAPMNAAMQPGAMRMGVTRGALAGATPTVM